MSTGRLATRRECLAAGCSSPRNGRASAGPRVQRSATIANRQKCLADGIDMVFLLTTVRRRRQTG